MFAVFNKEFKSYFYSASGYIFLGVFLLFFGIFVSINNLINASADYASVVDSMKIILLFLVPVLTMRIISEETHQKTDQLLYTAPIGLKEIVIGKYLASCALFLLSVAVTFVYPLILSKFGALAKAQIIGEYFGFILLGFCFISIGLFISSLTESQVVSAVATFGTFLFLWILDSIQQVLPTTRISGIVFAIIIMIVISTIVYFSTKNITVVIGTSIVGIIAIIVVYILKKTLFEGFIVKFFGWFSLLSRFSNFSAGILSISDIVYYISFTFAFVFLTIRMIEKRRWS